VELKELAVGAGRAALAVLVVPGFLAGEPSPRDLVEIKARGVFKVLVAADEVPETFSFRPGAEPGMEREMVEAFSRLHKLEMRPVPVKDWEDIIPALLRGEGDVILAINDTEARRRLVDFTREVMPSRHVVLTRKPDAPIGELDALRAVKVGVPLGTTWAEAAIAAGVPASRLVDLPDMKAILAALRARRITASVVPLADATLVLRADPELQAGMFVGPPGRAAWAVRKTDPGLKQALDEHLEASRRTGSWSRLVVKYYGEAVLKVLDRASGR
jgi:ABC-type amino acid transport substrate-binding protein